MLKSNITLPLTFPFIQLYGIYTKSLIQDIKSLKFSLSSQEKLWEPFQQETIFYQQWIQEGSRKDNLRRLMTQGQKVADQQPRPAAYPHCWPSNQWTSMTLDHNRDILFQTLATAGLPLLQTVGKSLWPPNLSNITNTPFRLLLIFLHLLSCPCFWASGSKLWLLHLCVTPFDQQLSSFLFYRFRRQLPPIPKTVLHSI